MLPRNTVLLLLFVAVCGLCLGQEPPAPDLSGHITRVASPMDFDVDGLKIVRDEKTRLVCMAASHPYEQNANTSLPRLGQAAAVFGKIDRKSQTIKAKEIDLTLLGAQTVKGYAVIDKMLSRLPVDAPEDLLVRSDGYRVLIVRKTVRTYDESLKPGTAPRVNLWMRFEGQQRSDGVVVADSIQLNDNIVSEAELKIREQWNYDPATIDAGDKQGKWNKGFLGGNPALLPASGDKAMQDRVVSIGAKLVPAYQRALAKEDPTRVDYRFQVVEAPKYRDAVCMPGGIILVPHHLIDRLQNDSQIAAVLASRMVCSLERQRFWNLAASPKEAASGIAVTTAASFIPFAGLPFAAGTLSYGAVEASQFHHAMQQDDRVALTLLQDAGYEVEQAPMAWWLLASSKAKPLQEIKIPDRATYLYQALGRN